MGLLDVQISTGWEKFLSDPAVIRQLETISAFLEGREYYPYENKVMRFLEVPLDKLKHIIVGMDPYPSWDAVHGCPQATGRSFEVSELSDAGWDYKIAQASLRNIVKAIYAIDRGQIASMAKVREEIASGEFRIAPPSRWFSAMEEQGVMFLNASLTVEPGKPGSHEKIWSGFSTILAEYIGREKPDVTWHLWGNAARERYAPLLPEASVLVCCHPRMASFVSENTLRLADDINWIGVEG